MAFPPEAWFDESAGDVPDGQNGKGRGVAVMVRHLFEAIRNPSTGETYTNAEVARMTLGDLTEEDVEDIRTGAISDLSVGQVAALAGVFGVEPSYLLDRGEPVFDGGLCKRCGTRRSGRRHAKPLACPKGRDGHRPSNLPYQPLVQRGCGVIRIP
jgi:hypothetical protein